MAKKIPDSKIIRMPKIEQKYGIEDLKIYAYMNGNELNIIGEIISDEIIKSFSFTCTVYDNDGDMIESFENSYYGDGIVTTIIEPKYFFNGYPFKMSTYLDEGVKISKIRVVPN